MLPTFLIFIVLTGVIAQKQYDCDVPILEECPLALERGFPKEREQFTKFCNTVIGHFECGVAVEEQCQRDPEALALVTEAFPVLRDVCGEDALLHAAIVDNLKCYGEFIEEHNTDCHTDRPTEQKLQQYLTVLSENSLAVPNGNLNDTLNCLSMMHGVACNSVRIEKKCGTVAMDAIVEILRRMAVQMFESCGEAVGDYLPTIVQVYKLEEEELEDIEQALKKK